MSEGVHDIPTPAPSGRPERDALAPSAAPPAAAATFKDDEVRPACPKCGYDLVGLSLTGVCPECGDPYTAAIVRRVKPWPGWGWALGRLGWPFVAVVGLDVLSVVFLGSTHTEGLLIAVQMVVVPALMLVGAVSTTHAFVRLWTDYRTSSGRHPSTRRLATKPAAILWFVGYFLLAQVCWVGGCVVSASVFG